MARRNRPGTKLNDFNSFEFVDINDMDGGLAVQQYIQLCIKKDPSDITKIIDLPDGQDENIWVYEHLRYINLLFNNGWVIKELNRQFAQELNILVVMMDNSCTAKECPNMKCTDVWEYLCAAHTTTPLSVRIYHSNTIN